MNTDKPTLPLLQRKPILFVRYFNFCDAVHFISMQTVLVNLLLTKKPSRKLLGYINITFKFSN